MAHNEFGYQRIPGLKPFTRMRACRDYANLPPMYRDVWREYKQLRAKKQHLEKLRAHVGDPKPRFKIIDGRPRPVVHIDQAQLVYADLHKTLNRMYELALYFWNGLRWIAPDYTEEELQGEK